jgi:uncharacterized membrane protein YkvI
MNVTSVVGGKRTVASMADQINENADAIAKYDVPLYEVVDKKTTPASEDSNNDYSILTMSTLNKDGIYAGISTLDNMYSTENDKVTEANTQESGQINACIFISIGIVAAITLICLVAPELAMCTTID